MSVEENDKRIKDAADHYHPAYDDSGWEKMEKLLDQHLPQQKQRRRIIFLLPLLLLLSGILVYFIVTRGGKGPFNPLKKSPVAKGEASSIPQQGAGPNTETGITRPFRSAPPGFQKKKNHEEVPAKISSSIGRPTDRIPEVPKKEMSVAPDRNDQPTFLGEVTLPARPAQKTIEGNPFSGSAEKPETTQGISYQNSSQHLNTTVPGIVAAPTDPILVTVLSPTVIKAIESRIPSGPTASKPQQRHTGKSKTKVASFRKNWGISLSAGPDISSVGIRHTGRLTMTYGAGISYDWSYKFTLRAGLYLSRKIYSVGPDDYHFTSGNYLNNEYLNNIKANCLVYEIPLDLDYHFKKIQHHNWFVSMGINSYLMKKETYDYYYKQPLGEPTEKTWSTNNENKHFFSVLNLSGGYRYWINDRVSLTTAPYLNLPLKGVGAGKVRLSSAGILFSATIKPFVKKQ